MKKIYSVLLLCSYLLLLFFSGNVLAANDNKIIVTIKPLHSLVKAIVGDSASPILLIDYNQSPHNFNLKPSQMKLLYNADVIFYIDENFEFFLQKTLKAIPQDIIKVAVADNEKIDLLKIRTGENWEEESDFEEEDSHHHNHNQSDFHLWLSADNAKKIVEIISEQLSEIYPENKDLYQANAKALTVKINDLDKSIKTKLKDSKRTAFMVFHDAYQYFEKSYNLKAQGSIMINPSAALSAKRVKEIKQMIVDKKVKCLFIEPQFRSDNIKNIISDQVQIITLDPLGANIKADENLYFILMNSIADNVNQCFLNSD